MELDLLSFTLTEQLFAADVLSIREIREWTEPTPLPSAKPGTRGVINLRGQIIPVVDLGELVGVRPASDAERPAIIIFEHDTLIFGAIVDDVRDIVPIPTERITERPDPKGAEAGRISGLFLKDEDIIRILDVAAVSAPVHLT
ncbi:MAG: chemotaxis protein CheW [Shimia sp.]